MRFMYAPNARVRLAREPQAVPRIVNCAWGYALGGGVSGVGASEECETSATRPKCRCAVGSESDAVGSLAVIVTEQDVRAWQQTGTAGAWS